MLTERGACCSSFAGSKGQRRHWGQRSPPYRAEIACLLPSGDTLFKQSSFNCEQLGARLFPFFVTLIESSVKGCVRDRLEAICPCVNNSTALWR